MKPIIFSDEMVRAIVERRKTQTRRLVKPQPLCSAERFIEIGGPEGLLASCPYGKPGDLLWVREAFHAVREPEEGDRRGLCRYRASSDVHSLPWTPSIHMPRWASRLTLEIKSVRVERVQDITEEDAKAEGIVFYGSWFLGSLHPKKGTPKVFPFARQAFRDIWDSLYSKEPEKQWEANPFVWVIEFEVKK